MTTSRFFMGVDAAQARGSASDDGALAVFRVSDRPALALLLTAFTRYVPFL